MEGPRDVKGKLEIANNPMEVWSTLQRTNCDYDSENGPILSRNQEEEHLPPRTTGAWQLPGVHVAVGLHGQIG